MFTFIGYIGLYIYLLLQILLEKSVGNIFLTYFRSSKFHVQDNIFANFYISKHFAENGEERFLSKEFFILKFGLAPFEN